VIAVTRYSMAAGVWRSVREKPMSDQIEQSLEVEEEEIYRVRQARRRISERFGNDPYRLVAHYQERQKQHPKRILHAPESKPT